MARDLTRIGERARQESQERFTSLYHYVTDLDHLRACYAALPADRAAGVDGVGKEEYGRNLEANLAELSAQLGRLGYRPQPVRRVYIRKPGTDKQRPLGILCFEDKLVAVAGCPVASPKTEEAIAALARIRVQWADALGDEAARIADGSPDDPKAAQLQGEAKAKLKSAFEVLLPAMKADKDSPELQLALADCPELISCTVSVQTSP